MNYIKEINGFYDWLETNTIPKSAISLWHALMHINNKAGWVNEFAVAISTLEFKTGFKRSELFEARNVLQQKGRLSWRQRGGNQSAIYTLQSFSVHNTDASADTSVDASADANGYTNPTQMGTINKLNYTKLNETKLLLLEKEAKGVRSENESLKQQLQDAKDLLSKAGERKEKSSAKKEKEEFREALIKLGAIPNFVDDWIAYRVKTKSSFAQSALNYLVRECDSAGISVAEAVQICAERSWKGFRAEYMKDRRNLVNFQNTTSPTQQSKMEHNFSELQKAKQLNGQFTNNHQ